MFLSRALFGGVLAFGAGIFFASFVSLSLSFIILSLVPGIILLTVFWQRWDMVYAGVLVGAASLGMAHYAASTQLPEPRFEPQQTSFEAQVVVFPEQDEQGMQLVVEPEGSQGRVLLFTSLFEEAKLGDQVLVSGKIQSPRVFEDFNYPLFLAKDDILWVMFTPDIEVKKRGMAGFSLLKGKLQAAIDTSLSLPESSLLSAMLLGDKAGLPEEFKEDLNNTGTRHITAVSGMHVAILSGMLFALLLHIGAAKKKSSVFVLIFLLFFVVFVGFQASAVRAGIMGSAFLVAGLVGRKNVALRTLVFTAGVMLLFNPLLLRHDIGFQLSFLAVLGIILFLPALQHFFGFLRNPLGLRDIALMSIAAQAFTLPLALYHFGILSFVSLATNLLIVPLLPPALLLGAVFLLFGTLLPFLALPLAFLVSLPLSYISFLVQTISKLPFAAHHVEGFPLWVMFPLLLPLSLAAWRFQQGKRFRFQEERMILWKV